MQRKSYPQGVEKVPFKNLIKQFLTTYRVGHTAWM